jgi:hypothetical protein
MSHQDPRTMLPSQERSYLRDLFVKKLFASLNPFSLKPNFGVMDALKELRGISRSETVEVAFDEAEREFDRKYPLRWSNEKQCCYRIVDGERVYPTK